MTCGEPGNDIPRLSGILVAGTPFIRGRMRNWRPLNFFAYPYSCVISPLKL